MNGMFSSLAPWQPAHSVLGFLMLTNGAVSMCSASGAVAPGVRGRSGRWEGLNPAEQTSGPGG